ncbi:hypothetical protein TRIP_C20004 [Candidatus Zixiibacteriota bacterium]|nr:hypothetical protein TRIP_C20004 [candidate division Zixibacteria bacterium]
MTLNKKGTKLTPKPKSAVLKELVKSRDDFWNLYNRRHWDEARKQAGYGVYYCTRHGVTDLVSHFIALIYFLDYDYNNAEKLLASVVDNMDKSIPKELPYLNAYEDYALTLQLMFSYRKAESAYYNLLQLYDNSGITPKIRTFVRAASLFEAIEDDYKYSEMMKRAEKSGSANVLYLQNSLVKKWRELLVMSQESDKRDQWLTDMEQILQKITSLTAEPEKDGTLMNDTGVMCYLKEQYSESIQYFDKAIQINESITYPTMNKGLATYRQGSDLHLEKFDEAKMLFDKARTLFLKSNDMAGAENANLFMNLCELKNKGLQKAEKIDGCFLELLLDLVDTFNHAENFITGRHIHKSRFQEGLLRETDKGHPKNAFYVLSGLHSYVPTFGVKRLHRGGGYYLRWQGSGIVIDPGFGFVNNFAESGLSLKEIDTIIITSSLLDHSCELESLLALFTYMRELRYGSESDRFMMETFLKDRIPPVDKKVRLILTPDAFEKYGGFINKAYHSIIKEIIELSDKQGEYEIKESLLWNRSCSIRLKPFKGVINTYSNIDKPFGFLLEMYQEDNDKPFRLGYTSDTQWINEIERHFANCDLLVGNIGPIEPIEFKSAGQRDTKLSPSHLGLYGCFRVMKFVRPRLFLVAEVGRELYKLRGKLMGYFNSEKYQNGDTVGKTRALSTTMGMIINLDDLTVKAEGLDQFSEFVKVIEEYDPCQNKYLYRLKNGAAGHS